MNKHDQPARSLLHCGEQRRMADGPHADCDEHPPLPESQTMWSDAEVAGLLDAEGRIVVISRNEEEAYVHDVLNKHARNLLNPESRAAFDRALEEVHRGNAIVLCVSGKADAGHTVWVRLHLMPSPAEDAPVLFHYRRLPRSWNYLSVRERDVVHALHDSGMNPKRAARDLGMSVHTLNAHRRSICRKCDLRGIGDFWVFVERCR
jgi:DNA-binding NarL/FixJ family response regulator